VDGIFGRDKEVDCRAGIWALSVVLYEMVTAMEAVHGGEKIMRGKK
jgi:hypothetical protein